MSNTNELENIDDQRYNQTDFESLCRQITESDDGNDFKSIGL
jgi:hypothetical protein